MVSLGAMFTKLLVLTLLAGSGAGDETPIDLEEELPENLFLIQAFDGFASDEGGLCTDIEIPERDRKDV